jgi:hypothetical protein
MVFTSVGLPVLPPTSVYELWFIGAGGARPAGLVPAAPPGDDRGTPPVLAPGLTGGDAIGVTVEPVRAGTRRAGRRGPGAAGQPGRAGVTSGQANRPARPPRTVTWPAGIPSSRQTVYSPAGTTG